MYVHRVLNLQMQVLLVQLAVCGASAAEQLARDEAEGRLAAARFEVAVNAWGVDETGTLPVSAALAPVASGGHAGLAIVLPGGATTESAKTASAKTESATTESAKTENEVLPAGAKAEGAKERAKTESEAVLPGATASKPASAKAEVVPEATKTEGATIESEVVPDSTPIGAKTESAPTAATDEGPATAGETKLGGAEPTRSDGKPDVQSDGATPDVQSDGKPEPDRATPDVQSVDTKEPEAAARESTDPAPAPKAGLLEEAGGPGEDALKAGEKEGALNTGEKVIQVHAEEGQDAAAILEAAGDKAKQENTIVASETQLQLDQNKKAEAIKALKELEKQDGKNGVYLVMVALAAA